MDWNVFCFMEYLRLQNLMLKYGKDRRENMKLIKNARERATTLFDVYDYGDDEETLFETRDSYVNAMGYQPSHDEIVTFMTDERRCEEVIQSIVSQQMNSLKKCNRLVSSEMVSFIIEAWDLDHDTAVKLYKQADLINGYFLSKRLGNWIENEVSSEYDNLDWDDEDDDIFLFKQYELLFELYGPALTVDQLNFHPSNNLYDFNFDPEKADFDDYFNEQYDDGYVRFDTFESLEEVRECILSQVIFPVVCKRSLVKFRNLYFKRLRKKYPIFKETYDSLCQEFLEEQMCQIEEKLYSENVEFSFDDKYMKVSCTISPWWYFPWFPYTDGAEDIEASDYSKPFNLTDKQFVEKLSELKMSDTTRCSLLYFNDLVAWYLTKREQYHMDYGHYPTNEEMAEYWEIAPDKLQRIIDLYERFKAD